MQPFQVLSLKKLTGLLSKNFPSNDVVNATPEQLAICTNSPCKSEALAFAEAGLLLSSQEVAPKKIFCRYNSHFLLY